MSIRHVGVWKPEKGKAAFIIVVLAICLSRMVWMQVRNYEVHSNLKGSLTYKEALRQSSSCLESTDPSYDKIYKNSPEDSAAFSRLSSPGFVALIHNSCGPGQIKLSNYVQWNKFFMLVSVVLMVFTTRFLTSSWLLSICIGAALLSRGELHGRIGLISPDGLMMMIVSSWVAFAAHFFKTAASFSLYGMLASLFLGFLIEKSFIFLGLTFPVYSLLLHLSRDKVSRYLIGRRLNSRKSNHSKPGVTSIDALGSIAKKTERFFVKTVHQFSKQLKNLPSFDPSIVYRRGSIFTTLSAPFSLWLLQKRRWAVMIFSWLVVVFSFYVLGLLFELNFFNLNQVGVIEILRGVFVELIWQLDLISIWFRANASSIDMYFYFCVLFIFSAIFVAPHPQLVAILEIILFLIVSLLLVFFASFFQDLSDLSYYFVRDSSSFMDLLSYGIPVRNFVFWFEPSILTIGIVSFFYLIRSIYWYEGN